MTRRLPPADSCRPAPDGLLLHLIQASRYVAETFPFGGVEAENLLRQMFEGIKKYQTHPGPCMLRQQTVVWSEGSVRLLHFPARGDVYAAPLVLVPSLINGYEILDLLPDLSFVDFLVGQGISVYVVDWGELTTDPDATSLDPLLLQRLKPAVAYVAKTSGGPVHLAGYCMGGLLMAGVFAAVKKQVRSMAFLATPWDLHAEDPRLTSLVRSWGPGALATMGDARPMTNAQIQRLFALIDPSMALHKYGRFAQTRDDPAAEEIFVAVEDWLHSGRDLPPAIACACLKDWYLHNLPARGEWKVGRHSVLPQHLAQVPTLVVAPRRDRLVETQTARALYRQLAVVPGGAPSTYLEPDCGHIGMMAGRSARALVWGPVSDWIWQH